MDFFLVLLFGLVLFFLSLNFLTFLFDLLRLLFFLADFYLLVLLFWELDELKVLRVLLAL